MRRDDRQRKLRRERDGRRHQRIVVGVSGALQLEVEAAGKERRPFARGLRGAGAVALQQRLADVAVTRARQRDQAVGALGEPFAPHFGAAAIAGWSDTRATASRTA